MPLYDYSGRSKLESKIRETFSDLDQSDLERGERLADMLSSWIVGLSNPAISVRTKSIYKSLIIPTLSVRIVDLFLLETMIQTALATISTQVLIDPSVVAMISSGLVVTPPTKKISLQRAASIGMSNPPDVMRQFSKAFADEIINWSKTGTASGLPWS